MQVVSNKCFLLNREKTIGADPSCRFRENCKNAQFNFKGQFQASGSQDFKAKFKAVKLKITHLNKILVI